MRAHELRSAPSAPFLRGREPRGSRDWEYPRISQTATGLPSSRMAGHEPARYIAGVGRSTWSEIHEDIHGMGTLLLDAPGGTGSRSTARAGGRRRSSDHHQD